MSQLLRIATPNSPPSIITVRGIDSTPLLEITSQGEVIAPDLESASEAGHVFVSSIRHHITTMALVRSSNVCCDRPEPEGHTTECFVNNPLNTTDDLRILSKIITAWDDGKGLANAVSIIREIRSADRALMEELVRRSQ